MSVNRCQAILAVLTLALVLSSAAATPSMPPIAPPATMKPTLNPRPPYTIRGLLTLVTANLWQAGSACAGQGRYADIQEGKAVTVTDATGKIIGTGRLATGRRGTPSDTTRDGGCDFEFEVGGIPEIEVYGIVLEGRGTLQYSLTELKQQNWFVRLQLTAN